MLQNGKMMNIGGKQRFKLELEKFISTRLRPVSGIPSVERGASFFHVTENKGQIEIDILQ